VHYEALRTGGRTDQSAELLASRLRRVIITLGGGELIGVKPSQDPMHGPVGPEGHGDHGHGDHGHGDHGHGDHGHGDHGHGAGEAARKNQDDPASPDPGLPLGGHEGHGHDHGEHGHERGADRGDRDRGALVAPASAPASGPASGPASAP
jgi:hypothetical protein